MYVIVCVCHSLLPAAQPGRMIIDTELLSHKAGTYVASQSVSVPVVTMIGVGAWLRVECVECGYCVMTMVGSRRCDLQQAICLLQAALT
jgi:hypothetical protein